MAVGSKVFDTIITQGVRAGQIPARTQAAREWYRDTARNYGSTVRQGGKEAGRKDYARISERKFIKDNQERMTNTIVPGSMYMYQYDAKHKDTLPYWDAFPLIFPFRIVEGGFYGINLHYLPLRTRALLMDGLYELANNKRFDESTKLNLNYQLLVAAAKTRYIKPCVKMYLNNHVKSRFLYVYPSEWDIALFLPLARFQKKTAAQVHALSSKMINS